MADAQAAAKEQAAKAAADKQKTVDEAYKLSSSGKPTPTQLENDQAKLGVTFDSHEEDGSPVVQRTVEAGKPGAAYATRSAAASSKAG